MADISEYIETIELAARGEEVRDAIIDALVGMNDGINYISHVDLTVDTATADSSVYANGYKYEVDFEGMTANTYVVPCLVSLTSYAGRYAAESSTDKLTLYFDAQPAANLAMRIYYYVEGDIENAEDDTY